MKAYQMENASSESKNEEAKAEESYTCMLSENHQIAIAVVKERPPVS